MVVALSVDELFDSLAIRVNGPKAWDEHLDDRLALHRPRSQLPHELSNGVLIQDVDPAPATADLTLTLTKASCSGCSAAPGSTASTPQATPVCCRRLLGVLDPAGADFPIVTP